RYLASEGRTVLVSSHMLSEVQQTVDDVVMISRGRLVHSSSLADLVQMQRSDVHVVSPDRAGLEALLAAQGWAGRPDAAGGFVIEGVTAAQVGAAAFAARVELHELVSRSYGLEDIFLRLTGEPEG